MDVGHDGCLFRRTPGWIFWLSGLSLRDRGYLQGGRRRRGRTLVILDRQLRRGTGQSGAWNVERIVLARTSEVKTWSSRCVVGFSEGQSKVDDRLCCGSTQTTDLDSDSDSDSEWRMRNKIKPIRLHPLDAVVDDGVFAFVACPCSWRRKRTRRNKRDIVHRIRKKAKEEKEMGVIFTVSYVSFCCKAQQTHIYPTHTQTPTHTHAAQMTKGEIPCAWISYSVGISRRRAGTTTTITSTPASTSTSNMHTHK